VKLYQLIDSLICKKQAVFFQPGHPPARRTGIDSKRQPGAQYDNKHKQHLPGDTGHLVGCVAPFGAGGARANRGTGASSAGATTAVEVQRQLCAEAGASGAKVPEIGAPGGRADDHHGRVSGSQWGVQPARVYATKVTFLRVFVMFVLFNTIQNLLWLVLHC